MRGGDGEIVCEAEGHTVTKLQWKKQTASGEESVPDSMVTNTVDNDNNLVKATLKITNAQPKDSGDYKCQLTAFGKQDRKLTNIRVDGKFLLRLFFIFSTACRMTCTMASAIKIGPCVNFLRRVCWNFLFCGFDHFLDRFLSFFTEKLLSFSFLASFVNFPFICIWFWVYASGFRNW